MKPEHLLDALEHLPETYLAEAELLQKPKKRIWPTVAALAACLCLVIGLWHLPGGQKSSDNASSMKAESFIEDSLTGTTDRGTAQLTCRVIKVTKEEIILEPVHSDLLNLLSVSPKDPAFTFSPEVGQQITLTYIIENGTPKILSIILLEQEELP